jgi:hypothetical protein
VATNRSPVGGRNKPKELVAGDGYHVAITANIPVKAGEDSVTARERCMAGGSSRVRISLRYQ